NIPEKYEDEKNKQGALPVTRIKYGAFSSTSKLEEVVLPESVKTIDSGAFFNCSKLKKVTIYANDASIGTLAFLGSTSNLTIKCKKGSTVDTFAKKNNIKVEYFEDISNCKYTGLDEAKYYNEGTPVQLSNLKLYNSSGALLKEGKDYNLEYENNVEIGTATVHVIGAGEYPGTMDLHFEVLCPYHKADSEYYTELSAYEDCAKGGKLIKDCTFCGLHEESSLPAKDHNDDREWKVTVKATCQKEGRRDSVCKDCNVSFDHESIPVISCDMQLSYIKEPTCKEPGEGKYVCTMCGRADPKQELPIVGHDYQWVTIKEATCTENGEKQNACRFCGKVKETQVIECAGSHELSDWVVVKEATCTEDGSKQKVCSVCGDIVEEATITKLGHTEKEEAVIIEATCEADGESQKVCATCGEILGSEVIPAIGHKKSEWKVIDEPSCDKAGKEGIVCENCGLEYETKRIEPLTHEEGDEYVTIKEPTCTESGIIGKVCKHCGTGKVYERKIVDPKGHEFSDWEYAVAPTCLAEGLRQRACQACGETEIEIAPATGHKEVYVPEVRPTYKSTGIEKLVCEYCGRDYHKTRVMPKVVPDLDKNGTVSSADALMILQHSVELILLKDDELKDADCNGDGLVNSTDALLVLQLATGIITAD
ncbi:MAG: leucine-rich repeat protein, partial [Clostridia bacterium]|nr:leucine-rich repeat protein [Clostridia bacterium]